MNREEFLQGLRSALSGEVPPEVVRDNLQYYQEYIRTEMEKGRSEREIMDELGSPRLIARTIIDATPGAGEGAYEEYESAGSGYYGGSYASARNDRMEQAARSQSYGQGGNFRYYDLNKWYWKLLGLLVVIGVVMLVLMVIGGILSIVIPLLPVIMVVLFVMWLIKGRQGPG
ncbi:DUF1700 domain-containing protein [bacterium D16-54]|nr:DUF1700 domain-containing protein [bacterium D16-54]RKJ15527.1 DUF1700 domain-containing protein [bacterium D16-56]